MGKYYTRYNRNLYIYVTNDDVMIDLNLFPDELSLFDAQSSWIIKDKMAIATDVDEADIDKAEVILSLNSFKQANHPEDELKLYYIIGDESVLKETSIETPRVTLNL